jgi:hypothetical protein
VQAGRRVGDAALVPRIAARVDSGQLDNRVLPLANPLMAAYHRAVVAALRLAG